jgi:hypothetical protein
MPFVFRPFYKCLWRAIEKHELGKKVFFEIKAFAFPNHKNIQAKLENFVDIGHLIEHDSI